MVPEPVEEFGGEARLADAGRSADDDAATLRQRLAPDRHLGVPTDQRARMQAPECDICHDAPVTTSAGVRPLRVAFRVIARIG